MRQFKVKSSNGSYPVVVGLGLRNELAEAIARHLGTGRVFLFYDANLYALHGKRIRSELKQSARLVRELVLPSGEKHKTAATVAGLHDFLLSEKIARDDLIVACGGGVTSDLVGYAAASVLRGVKWGIVTTTLLGMVDAAIGGKTGHNHPLGKNLIGAFWSPSFVIADTSCLATLPGREIVSGLGEIVKTSGLSGKRAVDRLAGYLERDWDSGEIVPEELIAECARYKADIVSRDERESRLRMVLNLGHTFAHGIEQTLGYGRLLHGEAVILGLDAALGLGERCGHSSSSLSEYRLQVQKLMRHVPRRKIDGPAVLKAITLDKKRSGADQKYILLSRIGQPQVCDKIDRRQVRVALNETLKRYRDIGGRSAR